MDLLYSQVGFRVPPKFFGHSHFVLIGWNSQSTGALMTLWGLLMFPANLVVTRLSQRYEDRELIYVSVMVMFVSLVGFMAYAPSYSMIQYIIFSSICIFVSTNILEGANMSLLSKTIPKSWAKGTFNSGSLATEAGTTAARSVDDLLISATAGLLGFGHLLNFTFFPLTLLVFATILLMRRYFDHMMEYDDDDDESTIKRTASKQSSIADDDSCCDTTKSTRTI
jgi:MFS family permease